MGRWLKRIFKVTEVLFEAYELFNDTVDFFTTYKKALKQAGAYHKAESLVKRAENIRDDIKNLLPRKRVK